MRPYFLCLNILFFYNFNPWLRDGMIELMAYLLSFTTMLVSAGITISWRLRS